MNLEILNKLVENEDMLKRRVSNYLFKGLMKKEKVDNNEIKGHIEKSRHNLKFVKDNIGMGYWDWCVSGCYYAVYHAALALIMKKGFSSKNHDATLCILMQEYYDKGIDKEDIGLINRFYLDYQDLLFYVDSKNKREDATYLSKYKIDKTNVEELRKEAIDFVNKAEDILLIEIENKKEEEVRK